jgi:hypothetical protein
MLENVLKANIMQKKCGAIEINFYVQVFFSGFSTALVSLCIKDMPEVFYFICYMS